MNISIKNLGFGVKKVIINDPKTYNSLSFQTLNSLLNTLKKLDKDNSTKVIVSMLIFLFVKFWTHSVYRY